MTRFSLTTPAAANFAAASASGTRALLCGSTRVAAGTLTLPGILPGRTVEAEGSQHPPDPRRPHHAGDAVEQDSRIPADAMAPEGRFERGRRRHHEAKGRSRIGELALKIKEIRAWNMRGLETVA